MVDVNIPTVDEETEAQKPRYSFQEVAWCLSFHPTPNVFWKRGSIFGLHVFPQSCVKCYVKVLPPDFYINTSYNNILKLPVHREGEQPAMGHTANIREVGFRPDVYLQSPCSFYQTPLLL